MGFLVLTLLAQAHGLVHPKHGHHQHLQHANVHHAAARPSSQAELRTDPAAAEAVLKALEASGHYANETSITRALEAAEGGGHTGDEAVSEAVKLIEQHLTSADEGPLDPSTEGDMSQVPDMRGTLQSLSKSIYQDTAEFRQKVSDAYSEVRHTASDKKKDVEARSMEIQGSIDKMSASMRGLEPALNAMTDMARGQDGMGGVMTNIQRLSNAVVNTGTRSENSMLVPKGGETVASAMQMAQRTAQDAIDLANTETGDNDADKFESMVDSLRRKEDMEAREIQQQMDDAKRNMGNLYKDIKQEDLQKFQAARYAIVKLLEEEKISHKDAKDLINKAFPKLLSKATRRTDKWMNQANIILMKESQMVYSHNKLAQKALKRNTKEAEQMFKAAIKEWEQKHKEEVKQLENSYKDMLGNIKQTELEEYSTVKRQQTSIAHEQEGLGTKIEENQREATQMLLQVMKSIKSLLAASRDADSQITQLGNQEVVTGAEKNLGVNFPYSNTAQEVVSALERKETQIKEDHAGDYEQKDEKFGKMESEIMDVVNRLVASEAKLDSEEKAKRSGGQLTLAQQNEKLQADGEAQLDAAQQASDEQTTVVEKQLDDVIAKTTNALAEISQRADTFKRTGYAEVDKIETGVKPHLTQVHEVLNKFNQDMRVITPQIIGEKNFMNGILAEAEKKIAQANQMLDELEKKAGKSTAIAEQGHAKAVEEASQLLSDVEQGAARAGDEAGQMEQVAGGEISAAVNQLRAEANDNIRSVQKEIKSDLDQERLKVNMAQQNADNTAAKLKAMTGQTANAVPSVGGSLDVALRAADAVDGQIAHLDVGTSGIVSQADADAKSIQEEIKHKVQTMLQAMKKLKDQTGDELDGEKLAALKQAEHAINGLVGVLGGKVDGVNSALSKAKQEGHGIQSEVTSFNHEATDSFATMQEKLAKLTQDASYESKESSAAILAERRAIADAAGPLKEMISDAAVQVAQQATTEAQKMLNGVTAKVSGATEADAKTIAQQEHAIDVLDNSVKSAINKVKKEAGGSKTELENSARNTLEMANSAENTLEAAESKMANSDPAAAVESVAAKADSQSKAMGGTLEGLESKQKAIESEALEMELPMTAAKRKSQVSSLAAAVEAQTSKEKVEVQQAVNALEEGVGPFDDTVGQIQAQWNAALGDEKKKAEILEKHGHTLLSNLDQLSPEFRKALHKAETEDANKMTQVYGLLERMMKMGMRIMDDSARASREHAKRDKEWGDQASAVMKSDAYKQLNTLHTIDTRIKGFIQHLLDVDAWAHKHSQTTTAWRTEVDRALKELDSDYVSKVKNIEYERHQVESDVLSQANAEKVADEKAIADEQRTEDGDVEGKGSALRSELKGVKSTSDARSHEAAAEANDLGVSQAANFNDGLSASQSLAAQAHSYASQVMEKAKKGEAISNTIVQHLGEQEEAVNRQRGELQGKMQGVLSTLSGAMTSVANNAQGAFSMAEESPEVEAEEAKHHALLEQHKSLKNRMLSLLGRLA